MAGGFVKLNPDRMTRQLSRMPSRIDIAVAQAARHTVLELYWYAVTVRLHTVGRAPDNVRALARVPSSTRAASDPVCARLLQDLLPHLGVAGLFTIACPHLGENLG